MRHTIFATALVAATALATSGTPAPAARAAPDQNAATRALFDYLQGQNSTGLVIVHDGKVVVEHYWPAPAEDRQFRLVNYGPAGGGALLEDVASQQKSFVAVLVAVALDKGLIDLGKPVSAYLGAGWSKAAPEQETRITVDDVLHMSSGLDERFGYVAPAGSTFLYNTPVYAITKRIVAAAAKQPLDALTRDWLTVPTGMVDTAWRQRPGAMATVGNATGLVTTPRDVARFGQMVLDRGVASTGKRVVSAGNLAKLFEPSATNPAYGRLWWLNSGAYSVRPGVGRRDGPLIAAAPADTVAALGALDRRLFVVPSMKLVVVRTGAAAGDADFNHQFWLRLRKVIG